MRAGNTAVTRERSIVRRHHPRAGGARGKRCSPRGADRIIPARAGNTVEKPDNSDIGSRGRSKQLGGNDGERGESDCALNADDPSQSPNLGAYAGKLSAYAGNLGVYAGDIALRGKIALPTTNRGNDGFCLTRIDVDGFEAANRGVSVEGAGGNGVSSPPGRGKSESYHIGNHRTFDIPPH